MSNRQLGWDEQQIKDRLVSPDVAQDNKEQLQQQNADESPQPADGRDDRWIPPGNSDQGSRK